MKLIRLGIFLTLVFFTNSVLAEKTFLISGIEGSSDSLAAYQVVKEAYRQLNYEVEVQWISGVEGLEKANAGEVDAELQRIDGISKKYPNLVQIEIPINILEGAVFTTGTSFEILSWHSLRPYRIGLVKGIIFAEQGTEGMNVTRADSYGQLLEYLKNGTVDVAVMPRINGLYAIKKLKVEGVSEVKGTLETLFLYHYVHKRHKDLAVKLEKVFKEMLLTGKTRKIRESIYKQILSAQ